jgi:hypothetical protein
VKLRRDDWDDDERRLLDELQPELDRVRARHRNDPPFELLRAAREEALPDPLQAAVGAHLERSEWSRALVEGAGGDEMSLDPDSERRLLARVTRSARSTRTHARWSMRLWIPAFSAAAVLIVTVAVLRRTPESLPKPQRQGAPESQVAAARPASFVLALEPPDVKLTQTALVLRSAGSDTRFVDDIAPALNAYRAGDYAEADRRFAAVNPQYPKSVELSFYHAIVRLFLNDAAGAIASLQGARRLDDGSFAPEISWYLSVAYERAGEPGRARAELSTLCRQSSAFSRRACEAASTLAPQ